MNCLWSPSELLIAYFPVLIYFFIKFISGFSSKGFLIGATARFRALLSSGLRGFLDHIQTGNRVPYYYYYYLQGLKLRIKHGTSIPQAELGSPVSVFSGPGIIMEIIYE